MTERVVAVCFGVATLAAIGLIVVYLADGQPQLEGLFLGLSLGGMGVGLILWVKQLFSEEHVAEDRPVLVSEPQDRERFTESLDRGEEEFGRRRLLTRLLIAAGGFFAVALLFPLRSLGPSPGASLRHTAWRAGSRLVTAGGSRPVRADEVLVGGVVTVFPEGSDEPEDSATVLIRVEPDRLDLDPERRDWAPEGFVAYSKICTHVGCPVGLYEEETHRLVCPCHQSMFDVLRGAEPVFGPAVLPLPQLPLAVNDDGELIATGDFEEPVGPSFWNRDRD